MKASEIPAHLRHLRTDRRGLPVPYINLWGAESSCRTYLDTDPNAHGMRSVFLDDADEEDPDFTRQNMQRQRRVTSKGLCQVCTAELPIDDRYLVLGDMGLARVDVLGEQRLVTSEPWLCLECASFALRMCPGLIRRTRAEALTLVHVDHPLRVIISTGWVDGFPETKAHPVAMWANIVLPSAS